MGAVIKRATLWNKGTSTGATDTSSNERTERENMSVESCFHYSVSVKVAVRWQVLTNQFNIKFRGNAFRSHGIENARSIKRDLSPAPPFTHLFSISIHLFYM